MVTGTLPVLRTVSVTVVEAPGHSSTGVAVLSMRISGLAAPHGANAVWSSPRKSLPEPEKPDTWNSTGSR